MNRHLRPLKKQLYLASASPRRKELLGAFFKNLQVYIPRAKEKKAPRKFEAPKDPRKIVTAIAEAKAAAAFAELILKNKQSEFSLIAADTLVFHGKRVLGKPHTTVEARRILRSLSGKKHQVYTAVSIWVRTNGALKRKTIVERSDVEFRKLDKELLDWYIDTGEPMDKAGAYGAQDRGALLIKSIKGSYTNVVGLPVAETLLLLEEVSAAPWQDWA